MPIRARASAGVFAAALWLGVTLGSASALAAPPEPRAVTLAREYLQDARLSPELRRAFVVRAGSPDRPVTRLVVPVTPASYPAFRARFRSDTGFAVLRYRPDNVGHTGLVLDWTTIYFHGGRPNNHGFHNHLPVEAGGYLWPLELGPERMAHLQGWLAADRGAAFNPVHCMEWLPNAELAPGVPLFHWLGLTRSRDGHNMKAKLNHAANEQVSVVGLCLADGATFGGLPYDDRLTPEQLLGRPPAGGLADAMR